MGVMLHLVHGRTATFGTARRGPRGLSATAELLVT